MSAPSHAAPRWETSTAPCCACDTQMTWAVADRGDLSTAEALYRENFQTRLRVLGPEDHDVLDSRHELAWIAACRGDWATAEEGYRETLDDSIRILGPDDPRILLTRHELAWAIANQEPEPARRSPGDLPTRSSATGAGYSAPSIRGP